ncbi:hypothetical protein FB45DRAFT_1054056 [Roridomyces roridus]|uniref:Uncharacterized protein n=1 Tax=Roridomyces roridus TaxID=1738132 RepID=A0AAD7C859_9AGAR|nr:hypothetical protein FB45DRAFT_1054056 [Roridomyces roridus]
MPVPQHGNTCPGRSSRSEVGNIVMLKDNDRVPADIVVLATSDGNCYLDTKGLDRETHLKARFYPNSFSARQMVEWESGKYPVHDTRGSCKAGARKDYFTGILSYSASSVNGGRSNLTDVKFRTDAETTLVTWSFLFDTVLWKDGIRLILLQPAAD